MFDLYYAFDYRKNEFIIIRFAAVKLKSKQNLLSQFSAI